MAMWFTVEDPPFGELCWSCESPLADKDYPIRCRVEGCEAWTCGSWTCYREHNEKTHSDDD